MLLLLTSLNARFKNFPRKPESYTINEITVLKVNCDFLLLIFNESSMGLHK